MARVKQGNIAAKRRKKIFKLARGFKGAHSRLFRTSNQQVIKALKYAYISRKQKKRTIRKLWITRINSFSKEYGMNYSTFLGKLKRKQVGINRKMISQLILFDNQAAISLIKYLNA